MDAVPHIYETADINSLMSDYLSFSKFDRSYIIVKNAKGLPSLTGVIDQPLSVMYFIKPGKSNTLTESIIYITSLFNEYTPVAVGAKMMSLKEIIDILSQRLY